MGSTHLDQDHQSYKSSPEMLSDSSSSSSSSSDSYDTSDIFEEPLLHPRVGDEYQAKIPPLLSELELLQLKNTVDFPHSFLTGLPIPVVWVYDHANSLKNEGFESENGCFAFPGLSTETWSDFEADCFLLGLYIFGKNLLQVKTFMETKDMGQILYYYYGQFHGSGAYHKWSECRKVKVKKCIVGERFLTGCRLQKLVSCLLPRLSEESKTKLSEASSAFSEGKTSLNEYVFTLKTLVDIHVLVEVVAIGKGKEDLTTLVMDSKNTQIFTQKNHPDTIKPSKKVCSSLTLPEIVKYLTGDIRLSKTRSSDLFWEAVWPRLLERGWHSEEPRVDIYGGSKNGLVFLMPGIKKFSRRKLIKGDDYFDSVTDVLAKVASQPKLIELKTDETSKPECSKEENGWVVEELNSDYGNNYSDCDEHHCNYLKPRVVEGHSNHMKFTVVDTSLGNVENPSKTREIISFPHVGAKKYSRKAEKEPKKKRQKLGSGGLNFVLSLPAIDKSKIVVKKNVKAKFASSGGKIPKNDEKNAKFSSENGKIAEPQQNFPTVNGIFDHTEVINRRQSTRNRPLTTKALEALEIEFFNPSWHSRKRSSSSLTRDRKHSKNESFVFSDITGFQERAAA